MNAFDNENKSNLIFNICKIKKENIPPQVHSIIEKSQCNKYFLLKKKKILHKKLTFSEIIKSGYKVGRWENEEHDRFIRSCMLHNNNWRKIQQDVVSRTPAQIRSHAQKFVIKLCKKYGIKMKNQKESEGEDNNFRIGIVPGSRIRKTRGNGEDLKFLMCFDYYRNNLIIEEDEHDGNIINESESCKKINEHQKDFPEKNKIFSPKKIPHKKKIKLINNKHNYFKNNINNSNSNKREFFKIQKKEEEKTINECTQELVNIVNDNQQFMNIYIKNEEIKESVKSIFAFLNSKSYLHEIQNIIGLFDLQNFIENMENTLKMWSQVEVDDVTLQ